MTQNQIAYRKAQEEQRHDVATEVEAVRHNQAVEAEQVRSDRAQEGLKRQSNRIQAMEVVFGTVIPELRGKTRSQVELNKAQAQLRTAEVESTQAETAYKHQQANLTAAQVFKTHAETKQIQAQTTKIPYEIENLKASTQQYTARAGYFGASTEREKWQSLIHQQTLKYNKQLQPAKVADAYSKAFMSSDQAVKQLWKDLRPFKTSFDLWNIRRQSNTLGGY